MQTALMLITRSRGPRQAYDHVDWVPLVFFAALFLIVGGAEHAGPTAKLFQGGERLNLQNQFAFTGVTALLSSLVSNVRAVTLLSLLLRFADLRQEWLLLAMADTILTLAFGWFRLAWAH